MTLSARIISDLIGKPYRLDVRGPSEYDCACLFVEVQKRLGRELIIPATPDTAERQARAMLQILSTQWRQIVRPVAGCCVFFPSDLHVGTMYDYSRFLHTSSEHGSAYLDDLDAPQWAHKRPEFYLPKSAEAAG